MKLPNSLASDIRADKALGQHFLFDPNILQRAALAAGSVQDETVFEIGPGPGGLTRALLDQGAELVIAVEMDPRFAGRLREWPESKAGRLVVIEGDARRMNWQALLTQHSKTMRAKIIANLPYNVATPLIIDWLKAGNWRADMAVMVQREVGQRLCAEAGAKHYGRLAVMVQAVMQAKIAFTLPPGAFHPPPKIASAMVHLSPLAPSDTYPDLVNLERLTAAAFGQRRKMLRASLKAYDTRIDMGKAFALADIDPTRRAETLSQLEFRTLCDVIAQLQAELG